MWQTKIIGPRPLGGARRVRPPGSASVYLKMFDIFQTAPIRTSVTMAEHACQSTIRQTTTVTVPRAGMETVANLLVSNKC